MLPQWNGRHDPDTSPDAFPRRRGFITIGHSRENGRGEGVAKAVHGAILGAGLLVASLSVAAEIDQFKIKEKQAILRVTYEDIEVSPTENLGLVGLNLYLWNGAWYGGPAAYGAVRGGRGGFFVGGFEVGTGYLLTDRLGVEAGLFLGGGGGAAAPQGSGLMIRPHVGIVYDAGRHHLGLQITRVEFPDGGIASNQLALVYEKPFTIIYAKRQSGALALSWRPSSAQFSRQQFMLKAQSYATGGQGRRSQGTHDNRIGLVGIELAGFTDERGFWLLETAGAGFGDADGYAEVLAGFGYRRPLSARLDAVAQLTLGAGGGGNIDTGGGGLAKAAARLDYRFAPAWSLFAGAGYVDSIDGDFKATSLQFGLGYRMNTLTHTRAGDTDRLFAAGAEDRLSDWELRAAQQTYLPKKGMRRKSGVVDDQAVHLVALKIDKPFQNGMYATGQAGGAYGGDAGGYAVGLVGVGWQSPALTTNTRVFADLLGGVGGGGGLDVGAGALLQAMAGVNYDLAPSLAAQFSTGRIQSADGELRAWVADVGLVLRFSTLGRRVH